MDVIWWNNFCGNETLYDSFWSNNITLYTAHPDLTTCCQKTILQWIPTLFILFGCCIYMPLVKSGCIQGTPDRGFSWLAIIQLMGTGVLIFLSMFNFIAILTIDIGFSLQPVDYVQISMQSLAYILIFTFHSFCTRRGVYNTGIVCVFWLLVSVKNAVILRSALMQRKNLTTLFFVSVIVFAIDMFEFVLTFLPDRGQTPKNITLDENSPLLGKYSSATNLDKEGKKEVSAKQTTENPQIRCSFPVFLLFHWFTPLMIKGYRRKLTLDDIWKCRDRDACAYIYTRFQRNWAHATQSSSSDKPPEYGTGGRLLLIATIRTFGVQFAVVGIYSILYYTCILTNPWLLSSLITFIQSDDPYVWRGYLFAFGLFILSALNNCFFHHHVQTTFGIGMRIRTALTSAIYRKILSVSSCARKSITSGEIMNLVSVDVQQIDDAVTYLHWTWSTVVLIPIVVYLLWQQIGPACLAGLFYTVFVVIINVTFIMRKIFVFQQENMAIKDERLKLLNQVLLGMKVIKLQAWEPYFQSRLEALRKKETRTLLLFHLMFAASTTFMICTPFIVALMCFTTYVLSSPKNILDANTAFVSIYYINAITIPLNFTPFVYMRSAQALVAFRRIGRFLLLKDVDKSAVLKAQTIGSALRIENGSFTWDSKEKIILKNIMMEVEQGSLVAVIGEVGSGKSSLIAALLGEMIKIEGRVEALGSKAYVAQQAWIQNMTLKDNILFGRPMDKVHYSKVIKACALDKDLKFLPAGDQTEIGERGINLSGGQKQRVALARAVYQDADMYFFDDPLSAVDAHVGNHIFEHVIGQHGILKQKTRIFVTNQVQYLKKTDKIFILEQCTIKSSGTYEELLEQDSSFAEFLRSHHREDDTTGDVSFTDNDRTRFNHMKEIISKQEKIKMRSTVKSMSSISTCAEHESMLNDELLTEEHFEQGSIKFSVLKWYVKAATLMYVIGLLLGIALFATLQASANIWLSEWTNDYDKSNVTVSQEQVHLRLGVYAAFSVGEVMCAVVFTVCMAFGAVQAARTLHNKLLRNVLRSPMSFFDTTPLGRILNRFSKDVDYLDKNLPQFMQSALMYGAPLLATLAVLIYSLPVLGALFIPIVIVFVMFQRAYARTSRQLKRLDSIKRSPVFNFFSETLSGVTSIRAYQCQNRFIDRFEKLLDTSQSVWFAVYSANRWIGLNGEITCNVIVLLTATVAVMQRDSLTAGIAGLALTYSLKIGEQLNESLGACCELENYIIAVERIKEYAEHTTEAAWDIISNEPHTEWPERGVVEFQHVSAQYRKDLNPVLSDLSFTSLPSEKIGIVGRTGAGKSSLFLVLFRIIETCAGSVIIDGKDISRYGLHQVRRKLSIIPQDPVLFSGSIRFNLDPSESSNDDDIWVALKQAHLAEFVKHLPGGLEYDCGENGDNLSVGQRQLVCMARALLKKSKVLVLDEATASIDMETDAIIQETLRTQFQDCTVITIAHRLQTILDSDRVMVLDRGRVVELDSPSVLLSNKRSLFYSLAREANVAC